MSHTIDERVVEMRFDNKQFESATKSTLSTLDRLKAALKFTDAGKGLEKLNKTAEDIRLDGIARGIETLTKRFSTFGIVGMQIIQNVTNALTGKFVSALKFAEDAIISGGVRRAMNIENAHFQLQALLKDEEKVQAVMDNAMESVDGTAYAYDEAAKAASMFAASGLQAGDDMLNALKAITGVAAMTNSEFSNIADIFTTVAGNGRLMGDQLLQLSSRGLNAASTIVDYLNKVDKTAKYTEADVRDMVSKGEISFKLFADAMNDAFGESAKRANETFTGAMSNMKSALARIGAGFISPLVEQNGVMVDMFNALRIKINEVKSELVFDEAKSAVGGLANVLGTTTELAQMFYDKVSSRGKVVNKDLKMMEKYGKNGYAALANYFNAVNDGSVRASYSITESVKKLSKGSDVTEQRIKKLVKNGKIDFATWSAAMDQAFGSDHQKLSRQFTDTVITVVDTVRKELEKFDVTMVTDTFYKGFNTVKNVLYGLWAILKPVGKAFANVFLGFNYNDISNVASSIEKLSEKFRLSDENAEKLERTFTGVFDILALVGDGVIALIKAFTPFGATIHDGSNSLLDMTANLGDALTGFSKWVRTSPKVAKGFEIFSKAVGTVAKAITNAGHGIADFIVMIWNMEGTQVLITKVGDIFVKFGDTIQKISAGVVDSVGEFIDSLGTIDFKNPTTALKSLSKAFGDFGKTLMKNEGLNAFVKNFGKFLDTMADAFSKNSIEGKINGMKKALSSLMDAFKSFGDFINSYIFPLFDNLTLGGIASAGLGAGIIASTFKISKALEEVAGSIQKVAKVTDIFGSMKDTLEMYQKDLKADAIMKVSIAIGVLAGSLILLSFADPGRLIAAAVALGAVVGVLGAVLTQFTDVLKRTKTVADALNTFAGTFNQLGKAVKWKAIGSAVKDMGLAIVLIVAAIAALSLLYKYNKNEVLASFDMMKEIMGGFVALIVVMSAIGTVLGTGMKAFKQAATGVTMLSASMLIIIIAVDKLMKIEMPSDFKDRIQILKDIISGLMILSVVVGASAKLSGGGKLSAAPILALAATLVVAVGSLKKLFEMDLPSDYEKRLGIFKGLFVGLAALTVVIGIASRLSGGGKMSFAPILAMGAFLYLAVGSIRKLMEMDLPSDLGKRFAMLEGIFITLGAIMTAVAIAGRFSGGAIKATGSILAMCVFLATVTASLMVLSIIDGNKFLKGAIALGVVLTALGVSLYGAGKISDAGTYKSVLAMVAMVGAITASLGILSMISWENLGKSCLALGSILLVLAMDFAAIGKISNEKSFLNVAAMVVSIVAITASLAVLAAYPWDSLVGAAGALSLVLLAFGDSMKIMSSAESIDPKQMASFLAASLLLVPIGVALFALAGRPWEGLLAAGVAMSAVMFTFAEMMKMISSRTGIKAEKIQSFLLASLVMIPIAASLFALAGRPWEGLLAAAAAMSVTLLSFAETMKILSSTRGINTQKIGMFLLATLGVLPIAVAISQLAGYNWQSLLAAGTAISEVVLSLSAALVIVTAAGKHATAALKGLGLLELAIAGVAGVVIAAAAINKIEGVQEFVSGGGDLLAKIGEAFGKLISGIGVGLASGLPQIGLYLSQFAMNITPFFMTLKIFDSSMVQASKYLVEMILVLTAGSLINGVLNFVGGGANFVKMGEQLVLFGPYIARFASQVSGINPASAAAAALVGEMIANLYTKLPREGGWIQSIIGESKSLADFGAELVLFGPSIAAFAEIVKDVKPKAVKGAAAAAEIMAALYDSLPNTGGLAQKIFGETYSLAAFGLELVLFGPSLAIFADQVKDVKKKSVKGAAAAAEMMASLYEKLPEIGGLKAKIFGEEMSLSEFGKELKKFGPKLAQFAEDVKDVSSTDVLGAAAAADVMATLAENLPDTETLWQKIFGGGKESLSKFGEEIVNFAPYITDFVGEVKDISADDVKGAMEAITTIVNTVTVVSGSETKTRLSTFGSDLEKFGKSLKRFYQEITGVDFSNISTITANIEKLVSTATKAGNDIGNALTQAIKSQNISVVSATNQMINKTITALQTGIPKFKSAGESGGTKFIEGITNKLSTNIPTLKKNAKNLGKYYVQGFAQGIRDNLQIAARAAEAMAQKADEAVAKTLDEHSPSRVAEQRGKWYDEGLANGIIKNFNLPVNAAKNLSSRMIAVLNEGPRRISHKFGTMFSELADQLERFSFSTKFITKPMQMMSAVIQNELNTMTNAMEKAQANISTMSANYTKEQAKAQKAQEKAEKKQQKYDELVQERQEWLKMSAKERAEKAKEEAKEAKILAEAQEYAYKKVYGDQKAMQVKALDQTTEYYQNLLKVKQSGNNKVLYEDKSFEEAEIDILQRITDTLQKYSDKFNDTRDSIMSQMNFFDDVEAKEVKTKDQLIKNAKDQLNTYQDYIDIQQQLDAKIGGTALGDYLMALGVDSVDQLKVINEMTEDELNEYVSLYDQKFELSTIAAKNQLKDFQTEIEAELLDILGGLYETISLFDFTAIFDGSLESLFGSKKSLKKEAKKKKKEILDVYNGIYAALKDDVGSTTAAAVGTAIAATLSKSQLKEMDANIPGITTNVAKGLMTVSKENEPVAKKGGKDIAKASYTGVKEMEVSYYQTGKKSGEKLVEGLTSQLENVRRAASELLKASQMAGQMGSAGFVQGASSGKTNVVSAGVSIGTAFASGIVSSLSIHSPSKVTEGLANYAVLGFIGGIIGKIATVSKTAELMGEETAEGLAAGANSIPSIFDDMVIDPVITPVVDLSNIQKSIDEINHMFNDSIRVVTDSVEVASNTMRVRENGSGDISAGEVVNNYNFVQNNTSPKALSSIDIYRSTKNQFAQFREAVDRV